MSLPPLNQATSLDHLKQILDERAVRYSTNKLDLLLFGNKNKTLSEVLNIYLRYPDKTNDFNTISDIKTHMKYREKYQKWEFKRTGDPADPIVWITGLNAHQ